MTTIGFIGLGNMGRPMAAHLVRHGYRVRGYDRRDEVLAEAAAAAGLEAARTPADAARGADLLILMLPDGRVVRDVLVDDPEGALRGIADGALVIDMSSSDPKVYDELAPAVAAEGAGLIDAPVSGGVKGAEAASLTTMAGGPADLVDRALPVLQAMSARVFRTGALGSGQAMKALNNLCSAGALMLTIEALLIGQRFGLDATLMTEVLNASTGRNNSTDKKILPFILSRRFDSGFAHKLMTKDVQTALSIAQQTGTEAELSALTLDLARRALDALGDDADHTAVARYLEDRVGEQLKGRA
ncbi:MAG TPA: NAD(P)-dependent oxidoreductase [Geminicoccaceae bacterium]